MRKRCAASAIKADSCERIAGQGVRASTNFALPLLKEPCPGVRPQQVGRAGCDAQDLRRLVASQTRKKAKLDQFRSPGICCGQLVQEFIEVEEVVARLVPNNQSFLQINAGTLAAVLGAPFAAGVLNEDATHRLGG